MAVESSTAVMNSLLEKLRLDDTWVPPRSWDSHASSSSLPPSLPYRAIYPTATVSESSLVRLGMNALQGMESALISIEKLYAIFRHNPADRTSHRIPNLWTRCSSASAVGDLLSSIGQFGCIIFLLRMFVNYFKAQEFDEVKEIKESEVNDSLKEGKCSMYKGSLINQAYAIAVGRVLDGYISALNTLSASVNFRRFSSTNDGGCLTRIGHSEMTLLEVYLHTTGLRTQIEALGHVCNVNHLTTSFPTSSFESLRNKADSEFNAFPRGGVLLSFLYSHLKVSNPDHCTLLKFLFLRSYEPYCGFIRSWIYDGFVNDPYCEFVVECADDLSVYVSTDSGIASGSPLPTIRVRGGVAAPCFLEECLIPLCRAGQQLQVVMKLLEVCNTAGAHHEILPCLIGLSGEHPWFSFPITFEKEIIETMVLARASYYQQMMEKIEKVSTVFCFKAQQVAFQGFSQILNHGMKFNYEISSVVDNNSIKTLSDGRNQTMPHNTTADSDEGSILDEYSYAEDFLESSECSTSVSSEDKDHAEQLLYTLASTEQDNLFSLDFSFSSSTDDALGNSRSEISHNMEDVRFSNESNFMPSPDAQVISSECDNFLLNDEDIDRDKDGNTWIHSCDVGEDLSLGSSIFGNQDSVSYRNFFNYNSISEDHPPNETLASSNTHNFHAMKQKYDSSFFSMNPKLNRGSIFNRRTMLGEKFHSNYRNSYFDFTSVKDLVKVYADKGHLLPQLHTCLLDSNEVSAAGVHASNHLDITDSNDMNVKNNAKPYMGISALDRQGGDAENAPRPNVSGGGTWESLLCGSGVGTNGSTRDNKKKSDVTVDIPLDFVIKRCLLDEILIQYKYLSKLTIKLLTEGFKLQEHLLALRRYHFMEIADWADLFITSLWYHKWYVEVDKRIPEIQGILELSVQRSSCEGDLNKDRLYVYLKEDNLSACATGIHSFDFLGLGYQVSWPVTIILTPAALKIYSEIFNFLIQVKLAAFCLSDLWCLLKNYQGKGQDFPFLIQTSHKVNHFVSTLQRYVQSQLSQISWCRFLHLLEHKVEDMLDLESVHMEYLNESLHICFLSNETKSVSSILQNILQCAMDLRSCLIGSILDAGYNAEKSTNQLCQIDISKVHSIRRTFTKNLEELYLIYLQSPRHGELGVSRFWDYLNYNEYYAGVMSKKMGHSIFHP